MGIINSFKTSVMLLCFGGAAVLFSAARQEPKPKPLPAKPKLIQVSPAIPLLAHAIASLHTKVVVDLSDARAYTYWGKQRLSSYPVAVGQPGWETPTGTFKVIQKQRNPVWQQPITGELITTGPDNPLGDRWISFWSDGQHQIGFHGTNKEQLIGQPVSHGCLRMRNSDIRALYEQVSVGTPVVVQK
ncbi:MAG: L,D-transpeptidase [Symplocastrum torsivum CPER-KK1]|jgi:lipoprotein-anchoring transpeptidase ErfK/SrfK|uniref:L,D-transpeptidase n=1 Tax=Symplocastrum torsivum CPER-KK1 TaxID=450513 RepID=A0A951U7U2_9CYAN|nr:L,D-transpeptidase [Symplocastrum torsivum CPER-KK1]